MHPDLHPSQLSQLPSQLKADAMAAMHGSQNDMGVFVNRLGSSPHTDIPNRYIRRLLPVFHAGIEPIPERRLQEAIDGDERAWLTSRTDRALYAIRGIGRLYSFRHLSTREMPAAAALLELWPKIWHWMRFHLTCSSICPSSEPPGFIYSSHLSTIATFLVLDDARNHILDTEGFLPFIAGVWFFLVQTNTCPDELTVNVGNISRILGHGRQRTPRGGPDFPVHIVEDLISGVGGADHLAQLCVAQLRLSIRTLVNEGSFYRRDMLSIFGEALDLASSGTGDRLSSFRRALWEQSIIGELCTSARALMDCNLSGFGSTDVLSLCFHTLLQSIFIDPPPNLRAARLAEALRCGFLRIAFDYWRRVPSDMSLEYIEDWQLFMRQDFALTLTSRRVVSQLQEIRRMDAARFAHPQLGESWRQLTENIVSCLDILEHYEGETLRGPAGRCFNNKCPRGSTECRLKQCADCKEAWYCSKSCQKTDWEAIHRRACGRRASRRLTNLIGVDSRGYVRAVLDHDYATNKEYIALHLFAFFYNHCQRDAPSNADGALSFTLPAVVFSYAHGERKAAVICIGCTEELSMQDQHQEDMRRAWTSRGKFQLHFVRNCDGCGADCGRDFYVPFPMHSTGRLYRALWHLSREVREELEDAEYLEGDALEVYRPRVVELIDETADEVEVH
ncbi:hypothetical protein MKEN_01167700 [Mycena kentingensis (nom. inval.)]|nr:hypothetical protein MKEN_01167700 [Mycena kentingensis (nom. inval.)]